jgi:hypothetical protein
VQIDECKSLECEMANHDYAWTSRMIPTRSRKTPSKASSLALELRQAAGSRKTAVFSLRIA